MEGEWEPLCSFAGTWTVSTRGPIRDRIYAHCGANFHHATFLDPRIDSALRETNEHLWEVNRLFREVLARMLETHHCKVIDARAWKHNDPGGSVTEHQPSPR